LQSKFVPQKYQQELEGLAAGSGMPLEDVISGNSIPEMFHCSGFAVMNSATADGTLYHGRVLDYACDWRLQEHAVLVVAEPQGGVPFVNVTYAGFIGSVTGMNAQHISIGEMGGRGLGHWSGIPMAYLVREVLETSRSLPEAISVFSDNPRTCEYYYVIADGETNEAVGLAATWDKLEQVQPGAHHERLPRPVKDTVLLSAGDRYDTLVDRVSNQHGQLNADASRKLMDRGVAMKSNLHNVLFAPKSTDFWVAHASVDGKPAAEQPYHKFQLIELLDRKPEPGASVLELERPHTRTATAPSPNTLSQ
jgi:predicted choloylglycine hydrolase